MQKYLPRFIFKLKFRHTPLPAALNFPWWRCTTNTKHNDPTPTNAMPHTSTLQTLILTRERHHEIPRLRVAGIAHAKSDKLDTHPLPEKSRRDHRPLAPPRDLHQREGFPQLQGKQLRQGIRRGANLH